MEVATPLLGVPPDLVGADAPSFGGDLLLVMGNAEPALDQRGVDLEVELQAVGGLAVAESLVRAVGVRSEVNGAVGDLEGVPVPLEDGFDVAEVGEEGVLPTRSRALDPGPADLLHRVGANLGAERLGEELRPEADAEDRHLALDRLGDQLDFACEVGVLFDLVDVHGAAEHDHSVVPLEARARMGFAAEIHVAVAKTVVAQQGIEGAEDFVGDMLKDEQLGHGLTVASSRGGGGEAGQGSGAAWRSAFRRRKWRAVARGVSAFALALHGVLAVAGLAAASDAPAGLSAFSTAGGALPASWEPLRFPKIDRATQYRIERDPSTGSDVVAAVADDSAAGLIHRVQVDLAQTPILRWRWKVDRVLDGGDARTKQGDDYPARIYLTFEPKSSSLSLFERGALRLARGIYGDVPSRAINYIWASRLPLGEHVDSPYVGGFVKLLAVESGDEFAGEWRTAERDVAADYRELFGGEVAPVVGVALMTDSDDTGERVRAWYGDIDFVAREAAGASP